MQNEQQLIDDLYQTTSEFISDLASIFTYETEKGDMSVIEFFYKRLHKDRVMSHTRDKLLPWKSYIDARDIEFFNENRYIFGGLPEDRISYYTDLIVSKKRLSDEDLDACWAYLDTMIACAESYERHVDVNRQHGR